MLKFGIKKKYLLILITYIILVIVTNIFGNNDTRVYYESLIRNKNYNKIENKIEWNDLNYKPDYSYVYYETKISVIPFLVKVRTISNDSSHYIDQNHYFIWFFGNIYGLFATVNWYMNR